MRQRISLSSQNTHHIFWLLLLSPLYAQADIHEHDQDRGLFSFVSRPDIRAPRWKVDIVEPDLVSPGYWYLAPFENIDQHEPGNGWIGPHIYDGDGELVWSGAHLSDNWDAIDFKRSNVRGEDLMTFQVQHEGNGYILDDAFQIKEQVDLGILGVDFNSHEFFFIEDGTRAISMTESREDATLEQTMALDWEEQCKVVFNGFKEWDTETWEPVFEWSSFDHIGLNESTFLDGGVERGCKDGWGWDFVHLNSVDKDHNGDFYVSARHADTIYKVSKDDGHVMWRLHGHGDQYGDFDMGNVRFSRQHNVRFRGFNGTHEVISILDNAKGNDEQEPSEVLSRGLVIALQTDAESMTASLVSSIDHPNGHGNYAPRRGNYQILPNDHIFIGWSEQAQHSEHTPEGKLVMEASLVTPWLGTYRSYKFPLVGRPIEAPRGVAEAYESAARNSTTTLVHVSWNGATEVARWNLYKTTVTGEPMIHVFSKQKTGFETAMAWAGYAAYVVVEAVDEHNKVLGQSNVIKTLNPPANAVSKQVADELYWQQEIAGENDAWKESPYHEPSGSVAASLLPFFFGFVCSLLVVAIAYICHLKSLFWRVGAPRLSRYVALPEQEDQERGLVSKRFPKRRSDGFQNVC